MRISRAKNRVSSMPDLPMKRETKPSKKMPAKKPKSLPRNRGKFAELGPGFFGRLGMIFRGKTKQGMGTERRKKPAVRTRKVTLKNLSF